MTRIPGTNTRGRQSRALLIVAVEAACTVVSGNQASPPMDANDGQPFRFITTLSYSFLPTYLTYLSTSSTLPLRRPSQKNVPKLVSFHRAHLSHLLYLLAPIPPSCLSTIPPKKPHSKLSPFLSPINQPDLSASIPRKQNMAPSLPSISPTRFRSYILRLPLFTRLILLVISVLWVLELQSKWDVVRWGGLIPSEVGLQTSECERLVYSQEYWMEGGEDGRERRGVVLLRERGRVEGREEEGKKLWMDDEG